jgi:hypothetical protein
MMKWIECASGGRCNILALFLFSISSKGSDAPLGMIYCFLGEAPIFISSVNF